MKKKYKYKYDKFKSTYKSILVRTTNKKDSHYKYYGGRGIICEWQSFEDFKKDMFESFESHNNYYGGRNTTIDRIDNNGNYCANNCRWITQAQQTNNKRKKYNKNRN